MPTSFSDPTYLFNRELSWLEFNRRVLDEALDPDAPLLERLKFLAIFSSNLDEFFMIRVANLRELEVAGLTFRSADGMTAKQQLDAIADRCHELVALQYSTLQQDVLPALADAGIRFDAIEGLTRAQKRRLEDYYRTEVFPVLTPMTVDPSHPFPYMVNGAVNLIVTLANPPGTAEGTPEQFAIVEVPAVLARIVPLARSTGPHRFVLLDDIIKEHIAHLFPGIEVTGAWLFRVMRNADLSLEEQEVENLLQDIERELRDRTHKRAVRLEVESSMPDNVVASIASGLELPARDIYHVGGMLDPTAYWGTYGIDGFDELRDAPFNPRLAPAMAASGSIFSILREQDLLLHHPYESFSTVVELIQHAATDKKVLAIKLTLYRTSGDSVIIEALKTAAEHGKQVTAIVELKARFDEKNNIVWARELERAGAHVVYGVVGLKTHCKAALVVRREPDGIRRYCHLATGNYNSSTAKLYTDLGFLTSDPDIAKDVSLLFNVLTGFNRDTMEAIRDDRLPKPVFDKLAVAPFEIRERLIELIDQEIELHSADSPGHIQIKCNSVSDPGIIAALYRASAAGVKIEMCIRGICCLRPGIPGVSDNISVVSVVDRFLEHPRIYYFKHGGEDIVLLASADLMTRNLNRRLETLFPVENPELKDRLINEILALALADNVKGRDMQRDGTYIRRKPGKDDALRSQERFIELARIAGLKSVPYEMAILDPRSQRKKRKKKRSGG